MSAPDFYSPVKSALRPRNDSEHRTCRELADHLSDVFDDFLLAGLSGPEADRLTLSQLGKPSRLRREIRSAKGGGMRDSFSKVLLPGVVSALAVGVYAIIFEQLLHFRPRAIFFWDNIAFVNYWYMMPGFLLGGAIGAAYSRTKGGSVRQRINAGMFMSVLNFCMFMIPLPLAMIIDRGVAMSLKFQALAGYTVSQVLVPGIPMLLGTLPFLGTHVDMKETPTSA